MKKKKKYVIVISLIFIVGVLSIVYLINKEKASAYLKIMCNDTYMANNYKVGDTFECDLLGDNYKIEIINISKNKIKLESSKYGLYPKRENDTISLTDKVKKFELYKDKELVLSTQTTDYSANITINWK